ncbi:MAG TPA: lactate utilization protein [Synergistales bacterium]|nr:lactate utilization protein [Synergistales bacterium]
MNEFVNWHNEITGEKVVEALTKNGFSATYYGSAEEAVAAILEQIPEGSSVGVGGSWTVGELDLPGELDARGHEILDHGKAGLSREEKNEIRRKQLTCDVFLSGTNAVTMEGELVNVDGTGNRVAAMIYGPGKVIIVAGVNKIVKDLSAALIRIKTIAAPINNKRLGLPNPCVQTGECMDCQGPTRICNVTTILHKKPLLSDIHVFIVGEDLGF